MKCSPAHSILSNRIDSIRMYWAFLFYSIRITLHVGTRSEIEGILTRSRPSPATIQLYTYSQIMKRRTLAYTPLAVKPFSHHAPDLDLSQFVANNVMSAAAAPVAASSTTGRTKKRKVFARTVNQKKEARRERRATSAMVGSVIRCRHGGDDVDEEELLEDHHNNESTKENNSRDEKSPPIDDDTHEENSVIGDHTEEKSAAKTDDMEDSDAKISMDDVNDHFDVDGIDNDVLLQADDDDDDDDAESNASTKNGGGGFLRGGDDSDSDESSTLEGKQLFRSSSSKKKQHMVIHDEEEEEDDDESKVEDGATRVYVRHSKTTPKYTPRNTDHGGGGGQSTTIRRSNRLGRSPVNTLINPDKKYSTDEDSDNEFTLSVTVRDNKKKRKVTASKCNKTRDNGKRSKISKIEHGKWVFVLSILKVVDCSLLGLMYLSFILTPHSIPPLFQLLQLTMKPSASITWTQRLQLEGDTKARTGCSLRILLMVAKRVISSMLT